jgi:hypothetical protein
VNLASAVFGLGAAILVFLTLDRWLGNPWAAWLLGRYWKIEQDRAEQLSLEPVDDADRSRR